LAISRTDPDRVPGTRLRDYLRFANLDGLAYNSLDDYVRPEGPVWEKLLEPVLLAALNTPPARGAGRLVGNLVRETLGRGGKAMRPRASRSWKTDQPALVALERRSGTRGLRATSISAPRNTSMTGMISRQVVP